MTAEAEELEAKTWLQKVIGHKNPHDARPLGIVTFTLGVLAYRFFTFSHEEAWAKTIFFLIFSSLFTWYCATIVHNTIHYPIFPGAPWSGKNSIMLLVLCCTYGYPVSTLIPGHNLSHHKYTQGAKDVIRTTKMTWSWNLINLITFPLICAPQIIRQDNAYLDYMRTRNRPIWGQIKKEVAWLIFHQAVLACSGFERYVFVFLIPQLMAKWGIITINLLQHDGCPTPEDDPLNFSRNFVDPVLNWFTCNNGYHTIHHHYPGVHWSQYPKMHKELLVEKGMNPDCDVPSIIWYLIRTFVLPGGRMTYDGKPFLPGTELWEKIDCEDEDWFTVELLDKIKDKIN